MAAGNSARHRADFDGFVAVLTLPEISGPLGIVAATADALDVLTIEVDPVFGVVAEVGQGNGP